MSGCAKEDARKLERSFVRELTKHMRCEDRQNIQRVTSGGVGCKERRR